MMGWKIFFWGTVGASATEFLRFIKSKDKKVTVASWPRSIIVSLVFVLFGGLLGQQ